MLDRTTLEVPKLLAKSPLSKIKYLHLYVLLKSTENIIWSFEDASCKRNQKDLYTIFQANFFLLLDKLESTSGNFNRDNDFFFFLWLIQ